MANRSDTIENKIIRHAVLFVLYLLALGFLFAGTILQKVPHGPTIDRVKTWIDYIYVFLGVTSFLLSFSLPFSLLKLQKQRLRLEEQRRRQAAVERDRIEPDRS